MKKIIIGIILLLTALIVLGMYVVPNQSTSFAGKGGEFGGRGATGDWSEAEKKGVP